MNDSGNEAVACLVGAHAVACLGGTWERGSSVLVWDLGTRHAVACLGGTWE